MEFKNSIRLWKSLMMGQKRSKHMLYSHLRAINTLLSKPSPTIWYKVQRWVVVHGICLDVEAEQDVGTGYKMITACEAKLIRWQIVLIQKVIGFFDGVKKLDEGNQDDSSKMHETYLYIILFENMFLKTIDMILVCLSPRQCMIHLEANTNIYIVSLMHIIIIHNHTL